jgi:1,4-alpha-glucan branching enzyme
VNREDAMVKSGKTVKTVRAKSTLFSLHAPKAKKVSIAGSFNNWDAKALVAQKDTKGTWKAKASLKPGRYEYKFVVDGAWWTDPSNNSNVYNSFGSQNSIVEIK